MPDVAANHAARRAVPRVRGEVRHVRVRWLPGGPGDEAHGTPAQRLAALVVLVAMLLGLAILAEAMR